MLKSLVLRVTSLYLISSTDKNKWRPRKKALKVYKETKLLYKTNGGEHMEILGFDIPNEWLIVGAVLAVAILFSGED